MPAVQRHTDPAVARLIDFFEQMQPADLARLEAVYTAEAHFKDPFNDVRGPAAIRAIFEHMYATLEAPRFVIHDVLVQDTQCFLNWDFVFRVRSWPRQELTIRGASHLKLAADGRIAEHRDYWDAAEELYEKLPGVGLLMRWLRRRMAA
jgi:limonene-1,2-epoxide hydrolase